MFSLFIGVVSALAMAEGVATWYFSRDRDLESVRSLLLGRGNSPFLAQPYLLYVVPPGRFGNEQGYRGKAVPMERQDGVARVLCLGGSTTFGFGVQHAEEAYPAQLERILQQDLPPGVKGVEVINGGLPFGTTAELLTHYHFKFHYFRPDLVIINTGGNEAVLVDPGEVQHTAKYYQPDYSHWRKPLQVPQPLTPWGQTLVRSRLASWLITLLFYGRDPHKAALTRDGGQPPPTVWHPAAKQPGLAASLADDALGFTHNLNTLITLCQADQAKVLLVPFRLAPGLEKQPSAQAELRHERILKRVAQQRGVTVAPFPLEAISPSSWLQTRNPQDDCHLDAKGCREKAQHIAPYARHLLWPDAER